MLCISHLRCRRCLSSDRFWGDGHLARRGVELEVDVHLVTRGQGGPGLGTCLGPARTEALVRSAGFAHFDRLPIKSQSYLFYAARP